MPTTNTNPIFTLIEKRNCYIGECFVSRYLNRVQELFQTLPCNRDGSRVIEISKLTIRDVFRFNPSPPFWPDVIKKSFLHIPNILGNVHLLLTALHYDTFDQQISFKSLGVSNGPAGCSSKASSCDGTSLIYFGTTKLAFIFFYRKNCHIDCKRRQNDGKVRKMTHLLRSIFYDCNLNFV